MEWINFKNKQPKENEIFWVFVEGRVEPNGIQDDIIFLLRYDHNNNFSGLDYSSNHYVLENCCLTPEIETPSEHGNIYWWAKYEDIQKPY